VLGVAREAAEQALRFSIGFVLGADRKHGLALLRSFLRG
jgi:hypothetical protein